MGYLAQEDVEADLEGVGANVSFFIYSDGVGLGAMNTRPAGKADKRQLSGEAGGGGKKKKQRTGEQGDAPREPREQVAPDKSARVPVTTEAISGTVTRARGKVAWIKPAEEIEHEAASKNRGQVYLHADDLENSEFPLAGAQVIFFVYEDDKGLGAEHCQVTEQGDGVEEPREPREKRNGAAKAAAQKKKGLGMQASTLKSMLSRSKDGKAKGKGKGKEKGRGAGVKEV